MCKKKVKIYGFYNRVSMFISDQIILQQHLTRIPFKKNTALKFLFLMACNITSKEL